MVLQPFRLWLGVTEYLFRKPVLLDEVITTAIEDNTFRSDDLEFTFAARVRRSHHGHKSSHCALLILLCQGWSECVSFGNFASYQDRFEKASAYFEPRFPEATKLGNEMIKTILAKT